MTGGGINTICCFGFQRGTGKAVFIHTPEGVAIRCFHRCVIGFPCRLTGGAGSKKYCSAKQGCGCCFCDSLFDLSHKYSLLSVSFRFIAHHSNKMNRSPSVPFICYSDFSFIRSSTVFPASSCSSTFSKVQVSFKIRSATLVRSSLLRDLSFNRRFCAFVRPNCSSVENFPMQLVQISNSILRKLVSEHEVSP